MQLTSLQLRILVKLAVPGRMTLERLLAAAMPRKLDINQRPLMENEIRLQIDLLVTPERACPTQFQGKGLGLQMGIAKGTEGNAWFVLQQDSLLQLA